MANPWLDLALGGLKGAETNQQRRLEAEERRRRREAEDLETRLRLAELASNPEFEVSGFPFVDAAIAPSSPPPAAEPSSGLSQLPPVAAGRARRWRPDTGWQEAPIGKPEEAVSVGAPGSPQGTPPPRPSVPAVVGGPSTPFLDRAIELGKVNIGGQDVSIRQHPGRAKAQAEAKNRAAFDALHKADPEAYPAYIEAADYAGEMAHYAAGVRAGEIETKRAARTGTATQARIAADRRRALAEDTAYNLFTEGKSPAEVLAEINRHPESRGGVTMSALRRIQREIAQLGAPSPEDRERRRAVTQGKNALVRGLPQTDLQQKILDDIVDGEDPNNIVQAFEQTLARMPKGDPRRAQLEAALAEAKWYLNPGDVLGKNPRRARAKPQER